MKEFFDGYQWYGMDDGVTDLAKDIIKYYEDKYKDIFIDTTPVFKR